MARAGLVFWTLGVLAAAGLGVPRQAAAQCPIKAKCIDVDLRLLSAEFGYGAAQITGLGSTPNRTMAGLNLRLDVFILSRLLRNLPIATYDALYTDLTYGKRTSDALMYLAAEEDDQSMPFLFGYHFLAGIRREAFALMAGLGYQHFDHDIGGTLMSGSSTPVMARFELGEKGRLVAMAWAGSKGMTGARVDLHLIRNLNLTATYWQAKGIAQPWDRPTGTEVPATAKQFVVGFRTAELR